MDTSYLSQQVTTIIERLHGFFDEIGVPSHERDSRESELFSALSETLHNQLNLVAKEKHDLTEEAQRLVQVIRQMERSLDDSKPADDYESEHDGLKITYPLLECIQALKEKHHTVGKLHRERYEQVKKLVEALESYASHLESTFVTIKLPPTSPNAKIPPNFDLSPTYVTKLDQEFTRVYEEYNKRIAMVSQLAEDIINLWSELGTPQAQVDSQIVQCAHDAPEQLGLHQDDLKRLVGRRDKLVSEKHQRERKLKELKANVESLWNRLGVEESERKQFLAANRGCGLRQINEFEDELSRLNELKRQNLHLFVEDARFKLQELWDGLYYSEEEMLDFAPAFSHEYTDALLSAHEQEIARLETLKEQRAPILTVIDRHRSLIKERADLAQSSQDASRLMSKGLKGEKRDPGKLLREEKMRKRITKDLPKVEADLRNTLESWEDEYGRPFCVLGLRYLDELEASQSKGLPPARSKTPNALPPAREAPRSESRATAVQSRAGTLRGQPPPRSKTPTGPPKMAARNPMLSASTFGNSVMGSSVSAQVSGRMSPSKIPGGSRLPMSTVRDGPNSPLRGVQGSQAAIGHKVSKSEDLGSTIRGRMGPPRVPPPMMKDLFVPPTPTTTGNENFLPDPERSASVVRHIEPEDPYDDNHRSYRPTHSSALSMQPPPRPLSSASYMQPAPRPHSVASYVQPPSRPQYNRAPQSHESSHSTSSVLHHAPPSTTSSRPISSVSAYPFAPPSRQTSNTSSVMSGSGSAAASGSENWETYTDTSETDETDASDAYYAKVKAQQSRQIGGHDESGTVKRPGTATGYAGRIGGVKRVRDLEGVKERGRGSEGGWTDDGDVGESY
ncbi:hypothetical protein LTR08_001451 [Meristemomyces frigidus]|nr:hypothetical protein LTR08_001451 [Meristemomyces frigidus]